MARILIADDRELVRTALRQVISQADEQWEVCGEAANGNEAVSKAVELMPDLIILDVVMPVLDGISAARSIRARLPDAAILIYTFLEFSELETMAKQAGAQGVVEKGDLRALIAEIRRVLAAKPAAITETVSDPKGPGVSLNLAAAAGEGGQPRADSRATDAGHASAADRPPPEKNGNASS